MIFRVVMDNGTGYTKLGYAGEEKPLFVIPTAIATEVQGKKNILVGEEAVRTKAETHILSYPVRNGQVQDWDGIEEYWSRCFFEYLRCSPEKSFVLLTEPPHNTPRNREAIGEIMFETFDTPGIYIGVQAVLSLIACWFQTNQLESLTGTVVDSGDGVTHTVPVVDGYIVESAIQSVPVAGKEATLFFQQMLRERGENILLEVAREVKEKEAYVAGDILEEFEEYERNRAKFTRTEINGKEIELGYEKFMAPEVVFNPEITKKDCTKTLPEMVDLSIQLCPIDTRRRLYQNIILSGGTTQFRGFGERLRLELVQTVWERAVAQGGEAVDVSVSSGAGLKNAVWAGGSLFASMEEFPSYCIHRKDYLEYGPSICRQSKVFGDLFG